MLDGGNNWFGNETTILDQNFMRNQCFWQWNLTARLNFNETTEIKILNPTKNHVFESLTLTKFHKFVSKTKFWCRYRIDLVELVLMTSLSSPNSSISISNRPFTNFDLPPSLSNFNRLAPDRLKHHNMAAGKLNVYVGSQKSMQVDRRSSSSWFCRILLKLSCFFERFQTASRWLTFTSS